MLAEFPHDWTTANTLGDCYYRAHQADKAVEQYCRIADHLVVEGLTQPAGALYRKILKITPGHEHALLHGAEIAAAQGAMAEAGNGSPSSRIFARRAAMPLAPPRS